MKKESNPKYRLYPAWGIARMCARNGRSGPSVLAELTGVDRTTVWAWFRSVDRNGTGGLIPTNKQKLLYLSARRRGINLTAEQIIGVDDAFFDDQEKLNGRRKKGTVA